MKYLTFTITFFIVLSCGSQTADKGDKLRSQDFISLADSITDLMAKHHYNPKELTKSEYINLEKQVYQLAKTVETKKEFIDAFNELWNDGPFSHVRLDKAERSAEEMAEFIDNLKVGNQSVTLKWIDKRAVLSVSTMTGIDTKEQVYDAYRELAKNEAKTLIIDLRNNAGGTFAGTPLIGHIINDSTDAGFFVSRKWWDTHEKSPKISDVKTVTPWEGWSLKSFWNDVQKDAITRAKFKPMSPHFDGKVYVLISKKTASAAEFAVDALANEDKVTIIGETSAGEMLSQKMFDLPFGLQLSLPIAEYYSTRIGKIEGKGVKPDIAIDPSVAIDLAVSLSNGENLNDALVNAQQKKENIQEKPFEGKAIYLFGSMNDWGKKWNITPEFMYKGKGLYEASTTLKKGRYEFKIAPMNWDFDYGTSENQKNVSVGQKNRLVRVKEGSSNLIIDVKEDSKLMFTLDASNEMAATLSIKFFN